FFNTLASGDHDAGTIRPRAGLVPHLSYTGESSAAATIGSRGSSVAGDIPTTPSIAPKSFRLHPKKEDATSTLVTRALITGNLDTAVELCIQAGRWADALLLAQGDGLVMRTRMAYFERQQQEGGYLRVFKGVVQGRKGLTELVRGADVGEWREVMVVLCRWAEADAFAQLVGELGERVLGEEGGADKRDAARVCFVAGRRLDKLVRIWAEEMTEEEELAGQDAGGLYGIRATAVQHFVEKAVAFCAATGFVDPDLSSGPKEGDYALAPLYERYLEYAEILAAQGMVSEAKRYVERVPAGFGEATWLRGAVGGSSVGKANGAATKAATGPYGVSTATGSYGASTTTGPYGVPAATSGPYGDPAPSGSYGAPSATSGPYGAPSATSGPYGTPSARTTGPYGAHSAPTTT
ncbi:protein transport protein S31, partial [Ceratobasidium sp. UAMH 11750]